MCDLCRVWLVQPPRGRAGEIDGLNLKNCRKHAHTAAGPRSSPLVSYYYLFFFFLLVAPPAAAGAPPASSPALVGLRARAQARSALRRPMGSLEGAAMTLTLALTLTSTLTLTLPLALTLTTNPYP